MKRELQKAIKEIVNKNYSCKSCRERDYCEFWEGDNIAFDCCECTADEFAEGVQATLKYLASIPWDKAMKVIVDSVKEE